MSVNELTDDTIEEALMYGNVVIDFWAEWCPPCKIMSPLFEELSEEMEYVYFASMDADAYPKLVSSYEIQSIPTFLFFKNGAIVHRLVGARPKEALRKEIEKVFS